ncbi:Peptidyl-Lys metalloendopeptidase [Mycena kentingensis (nom. inval.)]|nr:Peptidyl-Lys metalloendopeptidase [Mycena kentingensis (nom. inval.)]
MFSSALRATLVALVFAATASAKTGLSLSLSGPSAVDSVGALHVTATLVNTGDVELKLVNDPRTILSAFETNSFDITDAEGKSPRFTGALVKYSPEQIAAADDAADFTVLAPGASVEIVHDISKAYNFTTSGASTYDIVAANKLQYVAADGSLATIYAEAAGGMHTAAISGELAIARRSNLGKRATYNGCSSSRQTALASAATSAQTYASGAVTYLTAATSSTTRYTTWFGTWTSSRRSTVLSHYTNIANQGYTSYTYDCTCTDSSYAYVYPDDFGTIYLCNAFWSAPNTGTDSRAGTLIHESTHFTRLAGTDDYAYGQSAAKSLAISNPSNAIFNADSHEYFAENNPVLA